MPKNLRLPLKAAKALLNQNQRENLRVQVKAARALLSWDQRELAKRAGVAPTTIVDMEMGNRSPKPATRKVVRVALEEGGVEFIDEVEGVHGAGVRLKWGCRPARPARESAVAMELGEDSEAVEGDPED